MGGQISSEEEGEKRKKEGRRTREIRSQYTAAEYYDKTIFRKTRGARGEGENLSETIESN